LFLYRSVMASSEIRGRVAGIQQLLIALVRIQGSKDNLDGLAAQILKPLLGAVVYPIEKCRELSTSIITMYIFIRLEL